ncbi:hypothetical protein HOY82DRAFT_668824 [Tuber indicum]|nr:hypothetical protein HOY82DRAFT_668824 [Tuber indicum]
MAGKGGKSGKEAGRRNGGAWDNEGRVGKGVLNEGKFRVIGGGEVVLGGSEKEGWRVYKGLTRVDRGWENENVQLEDDMDEEAGVEVIVEVKGNNIVMEEVRDEGIIKEIGEHDEEKKVKKFKEDQEGFERKLKRMDKGKGVAKEVEEEKASEEEELGLLEERKLKKVREDRDKKRRMKERELEGGVVKEVGYVFGMEVVEARCFVMDREIRKVVEMIVDGKNGIGSGREKGKEEVAVESQVAVPELEKKWREKVKVAEGSRSYGKVKREMEGEEESMLGREVKEEKKRTELEEEVRKGLSLEEKLDKEVVLVMHSQEEKEEKV